MNWKEYCSDSRYFLFPSRNSPKLALNVDSWADFCLGLKMYNPSSIAGFVAKFLCKLCFPIIYVASSKVNIGSQLAKITPILGAGYRSSIYIATNKLKYVITLRRKDSSTTLVLKASWSKNGRQRLEKELEGIDVFSSFGLTSMNVLHSHFSDQHSYLLLDHLDANFNIDAPDFMCELTKKLESNSYIEAAKHPRILGIIMNLELLGYDYISLALKKIARSVDKKYQVVIEHGDLAPWNIYSDQCGELYAFDFEYFTREGIECFDLIKYRYLDLKLIKKLSSNKIFHIFTGSVDNGFFSADYFLLALFFANEMCIKLEDRCDFNFEETLLMKCLERLEVN